MTVFRTFLKVVNKYKKIKEFHINIALRDQIGKSLETDNLKELIPTIDYLIEHSEDYIVHNEELAHEYLYNLDASAEVGGKYIIQRIQNIIKSKQK